MYEGITTAEQNLLLLQSMIPGGEPLYIWCYTPAGTCIASSCPERLRPLLDQSFRTLGALRKVLDWADGTKETVPRIIGSSIGLQWAVTLESERNKSLIFVIGPVFYTGPNVKDIRPLLFSGKGGTHDTNWIETVCSRLSEIPVMAYAVFSRYVLMVHNTLTGQQLGLEALSSSTWKQNLPEPQSVGQRNRLQVYQSERALLEMVRKGDINYQQALQLSISLSPGVPVRGSDPLRQMKTSITVFTTLVCRAAIEGGLSPEVAYPLGDSYIPAVEDCRDSGEMTALAHTMYHDFIYRVHYVHANASYSHAIQKCCDYIELSLDRRIRTADLAALVGYTEYYLTEKFKKETGQSISSYIRAAKTARAKLLLETTDLSISEIADRLAFNTPNYFIQCFHSEVGCTPAQYRKQKLTPDDPEVPSPH